MAPLRGWNLLGGFASSPLTRGFRVRDAVRQTPVAHQAEHLWSGGSRAHNEVQYERNEGKQQQEVDQSAGNVEHHKAAKPRNYEDYE